MITHDKPNTTYRLLGETIYKLADIGATDKELQVLFIKGARATLSDIAKIEARHTHYKGLENGN